MDSENLNKSVDVSKSTIQKRLAYLIDNKFMFSEDKKTEILNNVQKKLGKTREEIINIVGKV